MRNISRIPFLVLVLCTASAAARCRVGIGSISTCAACDGGAFVVEPPTRRGRASATPRSFLVPRTTPLLPLHARGDDDDGDGGGTKKNGTKKNVFEQTFKMKMPWDNDEDADSAPSAEEMAANNLWELKDPDSTKRPPSRRIDPERRDRIREAAATKAPAGRRYKNRALLLEGALKEKASELRGATNKLAILEDAAAKLKSSRDQIEQELQTATGELRSTNDTIASLMKERDGYKSETSDAIREVERLGFESNTLRESAEEAESALAKSKARIDDLIRELDARGASVAGRVDELDKINAALSRNIMSLEKDLAEARENLEKHRIKYEQNERELKQQLESLLDDNTELERLWKTSELTLVELRQQMKDKTDISAKEATNKAVEETRGEAVEEARKETEKETEKRRVLLGKLQNAETLEQRAVARANSLEAALEKAETAARDAVEAKIKANTEAEVERAKANAAASASETEAKVLLEEKLRETQTRLEQEKEESIMVAKSAVAAAEERAQKLEARVGELKIELGLALDSEAEMRENLAMMTGQRDLLQDRLAKFAAGTAEDKGKEATADRSADLETHDPTDGLVEGQTNRGNGQEGEIRNEGGQRMRKRTILRRWLLRPLRSLFGRGERKT